MSLSNLFSYITNRDLLEAKQGLQSDENLAEKSSISLPSYVGQETERRLTVNADLISQSDIKYLHVVQLNQGNSVQMRYESTYSGNGLISPYFEIAIS